MVNEANETSALTPIQIAVQAAAIHQKYVANCPPDTAYDDHRARLRGGDREIELRRLARRSGGLRGILAAIKGLSDADKATAAGQAAIDPANFIAILNAIVAALPAIIALFNKT